MIQTHCSTCETADTDACKSTIP